MPHKQSLYYIRIQRWVNGYMEYMAWPVVFHTYNECYEYMNTCFTFRGLGSRKMSASIERCR